MDQNLQMAHACACGETAVPLISIVVPVYNAASSLRLCVESALAQTYRNTELVLVDDGSTDGSGKICEELKKAAGAAVKVIHSPNRGPAASRNAGIERSTGRFIVFLDSDDYFEPDALASLLENYTRTKADLIAGDFNKIALGGIDYGHNGFFPADKLLDRAEVIAYARGFLKKPNRQSLFTYVWGKLYLAEIISANNIRFNAAMRTFEDMAFIFDYLRFTDHVSFVKKTVYNYHVYDDCESAGMRVYDDQVRYNADAIANISAFLAKSGLNAGDIEKETSHAFISFTIISMVRLCRGNAGASPARLFRFIRGVVNNPDVRRGLRFYSPSGGDSRILPVLMRLKLVLPIILVCKYKAFRRYAAAGAQI